MTILGIKSIQQVVECVTKVTKRYQANKSFYIHGSQI